MANITGSVGAYQGSIGGLYLNTESTGGGGGVGTVTSVGQGNGIAVTPNPITGAGTVALASLAPNPFASVGNATNVAQITTDATGRVTNAVAVPITFPPVVAVTNVTAGTGLNVGAGPGGSITSTGTLNLSDTIAANTNGTSTAVPQITYNAQGRLTTVNNVAIAFPAATISTQNQSVALSGTVNTINFVGAGVTASGGGALTTVTIPGGGGISYATTVTSGVTIALISTSATSQYFTGGTPQTVQLPGTGTIAVGQTYKIVNNSTANLTVQTQTAAAVTTLAGAVALVNRGGWGFFTCINTGINTAAAWSYEAGSTAL